MEAEAVSGRRAAGSGALAAAGWDWAEAARAGWAEVATERWEMAPAHEPLAHVQRTISVAGGPALMNVP